MGRSAKRVMMLGLDAAELGLIRRWIAAGRLPALAALTARGRFGALTSPADSYAGGVWPSFWAARPVPEHGIYHNKLWRAAAMRLEVPTDDWLRARPFWESAAAAGLRVCALDVPMVLGRPRPVNGVYLGGWGTHDLIARGSWPPGLWAEIEARHGQPLMPPEHFGRQDGAALLALRERLLAATGQMRRIALDLLAHEQWDLACIVFGATHRAGHYLWDLSQIDAAALDPAERVRLEDALAEVYAAVDAAVGEICAGLDEDTLVLAFAVHGMGPNPGWADLLADMLADAGRARGAAAPRRGLLFALKSVVPFHWVRPLLTRLPAAASNRLVALWSARMLDWATTRHFPLPMDHAGYLRINLQGRERDGIVPPGPAYDALLDELATLIMSLRASASGHPLAAAVERPWQEQPQAAERDLLPDLLVTWAGPRVGEVREVVSDLVPGWRFAVPARLPSGRAGNHLGHGWFVAAGPGVVPGEAAGGDIVDLVPTAAAALGLAPDPAWHGRPLNLQGNEAPR
jgi:predicted AlkP superfamily phosphohydrolase/phosphomutase